MAHIVGKQVYTWCTSLFDKSFLIFYHFVV